MSNRYKYLLGILATFVLVFGTAARHEPWLFTVGTYIFSAIGVVLTVFVFVYARRPWKTTAYGRGLMYSNAGLAAIVDLNITARILGQDDWDWWAVSRFFLFTIVLVAQSRMLYLLMHSDREEKNSAND